MVNVANVEVLPVANSICQLGSDAVLIYAVGG